MSHLWLKKASSINVRKKNGVDLKLILIVIFFIIVDNSVGVFVNNNKQRFIKVFNNVETKDIQINPDFE
jgi:hypothetical protein